jgi:glycosyltransferase involved in cell wall biosynthesis
MNGISVVVCCFNSASRIEPTLRSLFYQNLTDVPGYEIIVVDNASTDETAVVCQRLKNQSGYRGDFFIVEERKAGLNFARLAGVFKARYDWILFCDDDNHLFPDYIKKACHIIDQNPGVGAIGGCGIPKFEDVKPEWFDRYYHSYAIGPQAEHEGVLNKQPAEIYGAGSLFNKTLLLKYFEKGFISIMSDRKEGKLVSGGDVEWCYLIQLSGFKLYYCPALQFFHWMPQARLQWGYYLKLKQGISSGVAQLLSYRPFFRYRNPSSFVFLRFYINELIRALLVLCNFRIRKFLNSSKYTTQELDLGDTVLLEKALSLFKNSVLSYRHFKRLQKLI